MFNWIGADLEGGYGGHVDSVLAMKPTPKEQEELGQMLVVCEDEHVVYTLTGVMLEKPKAVYREPLIKALDSPKRFKRYVAMRALLRGKYEGALDALFSRPKVQSAMRDEFPWELHAYAEKMTESQQRQVLRLFRKRFAKGPVFDARNRPWLRLLADLDATDEKIVSILLRIWNELAPCDGQDRFLVLMAMATNPDPRYRPALEKARKSRTPDIRDVARVGLAILDGKITL
jgi:hypothetical protein